MKKAVIFGAGNIGRGFLGQLFYESGYEVVFIDIDERIVSLLNLRGGYTIGICGENEREIEIRNVRGVSAKDIDAIAEEFATSDIAAVSVGVRNIPEVAKLIVKGIELRSKSPLSKPINLIVCENVISASEVLKKELLRGASMSVAKFIEAKLGLVDSVVSRMIPVLPKEVRGRDPLCVKVEEYAILPLEKKAFLGGPPEVKGFLPLDNLIAYEERKLFTHNAGHTICAYLGYLRGHSYIWKAIEDLDVRAKVIGSMMETGGALIKKHGFTPAEHKDHIDDLIKRFANKGLGDTVARAGRDPIRKLGPKDRLVGSARLAMQYGIEPRNISFGIAAGYLYNNMDDADARILQGKILNQGLVKTLREMSEIDENENLGKLVISAYKTLKAGI